MDNKDEMKLTPSIDFTAPKLVDHLNTTYGSKKTGKSFTVGDIQQYLRRGFLPKSYGGQLLQIVENEQIGLKVIRLVDKKSE